MAEVKLVNGSSFEGKLIGNEFVEKATISLVREYLYKKGFKSSLKSLNHEEGSFAGTHDRRAALAKDLNLEPLIKQNKLNPAKNKRIIRNVNSEWALESILEVLVKAFLRQNQLKQSNKCQGTQTSPQSQTKVNVTSCREISIQTEVTSDPPERSSSDFVEVEETLEDNTMSTAEGQSDIKGDSGPISPRTTSGSKSSVSKSQGKLSRRNSKGDGDSSSESYQEPLSPPSVPQLCDGFDSEFQIKKSTRIKTKSSPSSETEPKNGNATLNFLQFKQNALAQMSLTQAENEDWNDNQGKSSSLEDYSDPDPVEDEVKGQNSQKGQGDWNMGNKSKTNSNSKPEVMELKDIEDDDFGISDSENRPGSLILIRNPGKLSGRSEGMKVSRLDLKGWRELKVAVLGANNTVLQEGWVGQGFNFDPNIPYGLLQKKGGPCGVLAVVQSLLVRNLMFGSEFCEGLPLFQFHTMLHDESLRDLKTDNQDEPTSNVSNLAHQSKYKSIIANRSKGLAGALVEILWKCRGTEGVKLCLQGNSPGAELIQIDKLEELKEYVKDNLYQFDCIGLLYSAVLSRGFQRIQEDMDFPNSPLLGQHGYCSQEMVNLLLFGKCISNAFDNQVKLDDKVLQGIEAQSDIGLLSLFEHYGSCEVGSFLKNPKFPVWIVCSESHFSVLFSTEKSLTFPDKIPFFQTNGFDLYYYDGLSHQDRILRLTISFEVSKDKGGFLSLPNGFLNQAGSKSTTGREEGDENLVPPLEKCIRTKWKNSKVNWNGTEPIL